MSSYRLQLQPGFGFADAAASAGYLAELGVSHVYLSPILQAAPGSRTATTWWTTPGYRPTWAARPRSGTWYASSAPPGWA